MRLKTVIVSAALAMMASAQPRSATVRVNFGEKAGTLDIQRIALGQGGLAYEPMWEDRMPEIRALRPRLIRLFLQEYFDLLPTRGQYNFAIGPRGRFAYANGILGDANVFRIVAGRDGRWGLLRSSSPQP